MAARDTVLDVVELEVHFAGGRAGGAVRAVDGVSFSIGRGEALGLIGESGSGKTTLARALMSLERINHGSVAVSGIDMAQLRGPQLRSHRSKIQMIFQDPTASLNPRMTVGASIAEPLQVQRWGTKQARRDRVASALAMVGLASEHANRFPHELSGGQKQRVGIARALILSPELVICDEAVSALDVAVGRAPWRGVTRSRVALR